MRGWIAGGAIVAAASLSMAVFALQSSAEPSAKNLSGTTISAKLSPALSPDRDFLTAAEADAANRANLLPPGAKSLLKTDKPLKHGEYHWDDKNVPAGKIVIWVDLRRQMISVLRGGHEIGTSVIVYGADGMASPLGRFPIISKYRDSMFITRDGVALHGSPMSSRHATQGCIGLPIEFARLLFATAKTGDEVDVVNSDPAAARQFAAGVGS